MTTGGLPQPAGLLFPPPGVPGVAITAPQAVHIDIHDQVMKSLKQDVAPGQTMAMLGIQTDRGLNFAIAHKRKVTGGFFAGDWVVESWIGKSGFDKGLKEGWNGGVQVVWAT